jgi:hypothetical protein
MKDAKLLNELMKKLDKFEQKMDWVAETPIRRKVSELIVEIRKTLEEGVK